MRRHAAIPFLLALVLIGFSTASRAAPELVDIVDAPMATKLDGSRFTLKEIQNAIVQACVAKGWTPQIAGDNQVNASILVRGKHYAEVTIPFNATSYSILYQNSRELDYKERTRNGVVEKRIHRNYNKWVQLLSQMIGQKLNEQVAAKLTS